MAGKPFADPFGVDVVFGDPISQEPDVVTAEDVLAFAGIAPPTLRIYPIETHIAEKLHAYTMPRARPNSRVKDLPDLALLASVPSSTLSSCAPRSSRRSRFRKTHALPSALPAPPPAWETPYAAMARDDGLAWLTLADVAQAAARFLDPVLASALSATWNKETWQWR